MLKFTEETITKDLIPQLENSSEIEILQIGVAEAKPHPMSIIGQLFDKFKKDPAKQMNFGEFQKIKKEMIQEPKRLLLVLFIRKSESIIQNEPTVYNAIISETGKVQLTLPQMKDDAHYNSIVNLKDFNEIPIVLEDQKFFELCKCQNNNHD
jgi:hypothetical protein